MNEIESVVSSDKCGFFEIDFQDDFKIVDLNDDVTEIIGMNVKGMHYIDLVCPEDKENVLAHLKSAYDNGSGCIRHRIVMADMSVIFVMLTFKYSYGVLHCTMSKIYDVCVGNSLYKSNHFLESMAISTVVVYVSDYGNVYIKYANDDFYRMIGWNRLEFKEYFNESLHDIIHHDNAASFFDMIKKMNADCGDSIMEVKSVYSDGSIRWNEVRARYIFRENGKNVISLIFIDITSRRKLQNQLTIQNERFKIIQRSTDQLIFDYDTEEDKMVFNGDVEHIAELLCLNDVKKQKNELVINDYFKSGCPRSFMNQEYYSKHCDCFAEAIISKKCVPFDFIMCMDDETPNQWYRCIYSVVKDDCNEVLRIVGRFKNIDKQKKSEILMESRMHCDFLTGLLNKETAIRYICDFFDQVNNAPDKCEKLHALIIIDIDNFRTVNDRLGHSFGDSVIQEFASDVKSSFRDTDIVGRIGGDEFLVLMKNVTVKSASKKASRLCRSLVRNYIVQEQNICLSCSIGMSFYGKDSTIFDDLYKYSDIAMYNAKVNGRCSYRIYDSEDVEMQNDINETQNRTLMDPPSNFTETSELDTNLMDIAFSLMTASDDIFGTIDILIRTLGRKYNLSSVTLMLYDKIKDGYDVKNRWCSSKYSNNISAIDFFECDPSFENVFNSSNLKCVSDISSSNLSPPIKNNMKNNDVRAFVIGRLEGRGSVKYGYMVFVQCERKRKWSRKETNTFKYITKIISIALADRYFNSKEENLR